MNNSILGTIKKLLGLTDEYIHFDPDILIAINTSISTLTQLGVGPNEGFYVSSGIETWDQLLGDRKDLECVKTYIYISSRLIFDPPQNSFLVESYNRILKEQEWRIVNLMEKGEGTNA